MVHTSEKRNSSIRDLESLFSRRFNIHILISNQTNAENRWVLTLLVCEDNSYNYHLLMV